MSYEFYKVLHLTGIILVFSGLMGLLTVKMAGAALEGKTKSLIFASHGLGLVLALVGGFGLLAKLGLMQNLPGWVFGKLAVWLLLGGAVALVKRKGQAGWPVFSGLLILFIVAAWLAVFKPF